METENKKKYDNKKYYQNFKEKHKDEIKETITCEICGGSYKYFNKPIHNKTKKHIEFINGIRQKKDKQLQTNFLELPIEEQIQCLIKIHNLKCGELNHNELKINN